MLANEWSPTDCETVLKLHAKKLPWCVIAERLGRTEKAVRFKIRSLTMPPEIKAEWNRRRQLSRKDTTRPAYKPHVVEAMDHECANRLLDERDMRQSVPYRDLTALLMGDPRPGSSALEKRCPLTT